MSVKTCVMQQSGMSTEEQTAVSQPIHSQQFKPSGQQLVFLISTKTGEVLDIAQLKL